jgi:hypothetical protein
VLQTGNADYVLPLNKAETVQTALTSSCTRLSRSAEILFTIIPRGYSLGKSDNKNKQSGIEKRPCAI